MRGVIFHRNQDHGKDEQEQGAGACIRGKLLTGKYMDAIKEHEEKIWMLIKRLQGTQDRMERGQERRQRGRAKEMRQIY